MASKEKHNERSKRSSKNSKAGMNAMDWNSQLKTQQRRRLKDIRNEYYSKCPN